MKAGPYFVLFLAFTDIVFGKLFLVETEDKEPSGFETEDEELSGPETYENDSYEDDADQVDPNLLHLQSSFNRNRKKTTPETKKKGSGEDFTVPPGGSAKSSAVLIEDKGEGIIQGGMVVPKGQSLDKNALTNLVTQGGNRLMVSGQQIIGPELQNSITSLISGLFGGSGPTGAQNGVGQPKGEQSGPQPYTTEDDEAASVPVSKSCKGAPQRVIKAMNKFRKKHGVGPVKLDKKISKFSQNWANTKKGAMTLLPHSSLQPGLTNAEGMALNQSPEGAVASYYSESKGFDYNNPSRNQGGKVRGHFIDMIWKNQKGVGVGCVNAGSPGSFIYVTNYNKDQGTMEDNVLPPKK